MNSEPQSSPRRSPEYTFYREVTAVDSLIETNKVVGINMDGYHSAHIQIKPAGGANPTTNVLWWCEGAGKFIQEHSAISKAGVGADTPYEFTVECKGRIMYVALNPMAAGSAKIYIAGYNKLDS